MAQAPPAGPIHVSVHVTNPNATPHKIAQAAETGTREALDKQTRKNIPSFAAGTDD